MTTKNETLTALAEQLGFLSLETSHTSADFCNVSISRAAEALDAAYEAGRLHDTSAAATPAPSGGPVNGMTLRDHFAAQAMQGLLARGLHYSTEGINSPRHGLDDEDVAGHAYGMADAMLKAREAA